MNISAEGEFVFHQHRYMHVCLGILNPKLRIPVVDLEFRYGCTLHILELRVQTPSNSLRVNALCVLTPLTVYARLKLNRCRDRTMKVGSSAVHHGSYVLRYTRERALSNSFYVWTPHLKWDELVGTSYVENIACPKQQLRKETCPISFYLK